MIKSTAIALLVAFAATAAQPVWPNSKAGTIARGWVTAFNAGEKPMREFTAKNYTAESLVQRPIEQRMSTYRDLRKRFKSLKLAAVKRETASTLEVTLTDGEGKSHEVTFEVQKQAPFKLKMIKIQSSEPHGGGLFPHH